MNSDTFGTEPEPINVDEGTMHTYTIAKRPDALPLWWEACFSSVTYEPVSCQ